MTRLYTPDGEDVVRACIGATGISRSMPRSGHHSFGCRLNGSVSQAGVDLYISIAQTLVFVQ